MIFPSIVQETLGLIMLESMAAGVPVIGSSIWSVNELVADGVSGLIFKTGDVKSLEVVLTKILDDPIILKKLASGIRQPADINSVSGITAAIYKEALINSKCN
jgi:glycosyltransferase involved in cell wall biosynthesis